MWSLVKFFSEGRVLPPLREWRAVALKLLSRKCFANTVTLMDSSSSHRQCTWDIYVQFQGFVCPSKIHPWPPVKPWSGSASLPFPSPSLQTPSAAVEGGYRIGLIVAANAYFGDLLGYNSRVDRTTISTHQADCQRRGTQDRQVSPQKPIPPL